MSALQALEDGGHCKSELSHIALDIDRLITSHDIKITMQWIPGHSNTPGNDKADRLAKKGSTQEQPITATTLHTAKQILMTTNKEIWLNRWAMGNTGRDVYTHMASPNLNDNINHLTRRDQSTIFRLRTQHITLNNYLNRIHPQHTPECQLCAHHHETVHHHLFKCQALEDIRKTVLPPKPDKWNTLYGTKEQLTNTCRYHYIALGRRAKAQVPLDH